MTDPPPAALRRTQASRTAETRDLLIQAAVRVIYRLGFAGATTGLIADEAGLSRGSIIHQFGTRAALMADVVRNVYDQEAQDYIAFQQTLKIGDHLSDWVQLCWRVLSKPSGVAVLEILQATRSDLELAALVSPMQAGIEQRALQGQLDRFGGDEQEALAQMRLVVWAIRGLTIGQVLAPKPDEIQRSVDLLEALVRRGFPPSKAQEGMAPRNPLQSL